MIADLWTLLCVVLSLLGACAVAGISFCRLSIMSHTTTKLLARVAFWLLGSLSLLAIFKMVFWGWLPDVAHAALFVSAAYLMFNQRELWHHGVPTVYRKGGKRNELRHGL